MSKTPSEIVRVRREHATLYMRLPPFWLKDEHVENGDYVVCRPGPDGSFIVRAFEREVQDARKADVRK